ncbi:hypothetical protein DTO013F2_8641 [Penicillium roqueforti]|nr:hypothetical protein DTO013F2_8641 [Penicillium roqueforti]
MCSSTNDGHVPANSPTVAIQGLAVPGTATNPIVIEEDYAPLGSARNPIMVHVKEGYNYSGIPTLAPTKSPVYGHPERPQAPRESYVNHALSDYESTSHGYRKDGSERGTQQRSKHGDASGAATITIDSLIHQDLNSH